MTAFHRAASFRRRIASAKRGVVSAVKNRRGFTLVELIVSFTLTAMLVTASSVALGSAYSVWLHVMSVNRAASVAGILVDELTSEISTMSDVGRQKIESDGAETVICDEYGISIDGTGSFNYLTYTDENGHPAVLAASSFKYAGAAEGGSAQSLVEKTLDDGLLHIYYKSVSSADGEASDVSESAGYSDIDWHYDANTYMGNRITKLLFSREPDADRVYKVELELTNQLTGYVYSTTRYIKCYNLPKTS